MAEENTERQILQTPPEIVRHKYEAKLWVTKYNTELHKPFKIKKSDKHTFESFCTSESCTFKLKYNFKKYVGYKLKCFQLHNCNFDIDIFRSVAFVDQIEQLERDFTATRARDISNHIISTRGTTLNYNQSYYCLRKVNQKNDEERAKSYGYIKPWLEWNKQNNADSHFLYGEKLSLGNLLPKFEYCFYCPSQSKQAVINTLPIIVIDACHAKKSYRGMIFSASIVTGANTLYRIAIGIAPTENYNYWKVFLTGLNEALNLSNVHNLVVISDREKGIKAALEEVIPNAKHSLCVFHIEKNIKKLFKTDTGGLLWKAARANTRDEFNKYIDEIQVRDGLLVSNYIRNIEPSLWATFCFPCPRYGHITSNIAESLNSSFSSLRKLLPFEMLLEFVYRHEVNIIKNRNKLIDATDEDTIEKINIKINFNKTKARNLRLIERADTNFVEIQSERGNNYNRVYNKTSRVCSCNNDKEFGYPCVHACKVIQRFGLNESEFISPLLKIGAIKRLYSLSPDVPVDVSTLTRHETEGVVEVTRRGRPRRNDIRIPSAGERISRRSVICGLCSQPGHNRRTCPNRENN